MAYMTTSMSLAWAMDTTGSQVCWLSNKLHIYRLHLPELFYNFAVESKHQQPF